MLGSPCHAPISAKWPTHADPRLDAIINRLECTGPLGWRNIMKYATAEECMGTYAQLCVAFGPGARKKSKVFFARRREVMAFLTPEERVRVFSLVSTQALRGAAALKRTVKFGKPLARFDPTGRRFTQTPFPALVLADGSIALNRLEAASIRFPALDDVTVNLGDALRDDKGFTDASRALILAKLCTFTFITKLDLSGNNIRVLPDAIGALTKLEYLDLSGNNIAVVPDAIGALTKLEYLDLGFNRIATLPTTIGGMTALTTLYLGANQLAGLPDAIGTLTNLETLDLEENQLVGLPDAIGALTKLEYLELTDNNIATLPTTIGALTNLEKLVLEENQLVGLPDAIGALTKLEYLDLNDNQLVGLPGEICGMTALKTLYLGHNQLVGLPDEICGMTALKHLYLHENDNLIRSEQSAAMQAWLQELEDSPTCTLTVTSAIRDEWLNLQY